MTPRDALLAALAGPEWVEQAACRGLDPNVTSLLTRHATIVGDCWVWRTRGSHGYGTLTYQGRKGMTAHRLMYELLVGPIPPGVHLDHLCQNKPCANPSHLEIVSPAENARRHFAQRDLPTHCSNGHELTPDNVFIVGTIRRCRTCRRATQREWARGEQARRRANR